MSYLLLENAAEIATPLGHKAHCGKEMNELCVLKNAALLMEDDKILKVAEQSEMESFIAEKLPHEKILRHSVAGKTLLPGFVDSHTHFIFGGFRDEEFNMRLHGASYMEIMEKGGGIAATVESTEKASFAELYEAGYKRLDAMMRQGVTTIEGKTGYGETTKTESKMLSVMEALQKNHELDIVFTYLGAHFVPDRFKGKTHEFIDYLIKEGLPMAQGRATFCDVFCEKNVIELDDSERLLRAAQEMGFKLKLHADEIVQLGGSELAGKLHAISADHLLKASDEGLLAMQKAGTIATLLPCTAFSLKEPYARGRYMIDHGLAVALASDLNPGSCYTSSVPLMIALATIYMGLTIEETITAITLNGAAAIDLAAETGSLEVGKKADVVVLDAPNHGHLSYHFAMNQVETVIKNGRIVYSTAK